MPFSPLPNVDFNRNPLDVSPVVDALNTARQYGLQQNKLAMENERLGFERELQPLRVQSAQQGVAAGADAASARKAGAFSDFVYNNFNPNSPNYITNPAERTEKWNKFLPTLGSMSQMSDPVIRPMIENPDTGHQIIYSIAHEYKPDDPLQRRMLQAQVSGAEETLAATRALRSDLGGGGEGATPATSRAPTPTTYGTAPAQQSSVGGQNALPPIARPYMPSQQQVGSTQALGNQSGVEAPLPGVAVTAPKMNGPPQQSAEGLADVQAIAPRVAAVTPDQTAVDAGGRPLLNIASEINKARRMIASGVPAYVSAGETHMKFMQAILEKGTMPTQTGGVMDVPGSAESAARRKGLEETATGNAKYYDTLHKGLVGSAMIAAQQKQNIDLIRQVIGDQGFGMGSASSLQQGTLRALATLGIAPEAAANREVFNQTMARILADQFSGLKSIASTTGETGARIFKPMLDMEEKAIASADDSVPGIRRKIDILDKAGDLMMQWGDMADKHVQQYGRLDPHFDTALRGTIAAARIPNFGAEAAQGKAAPAKGETPAGPAVTKEKLLALPDGPVDLGGARYLKRGSQLIPVEGELGSVGNPYGSKPEVMRPGLHAYENGKIYKRTPNLITDRWQEVQ